MKSDHIGRGFGEIVGPDARKRRPTDTALYREAYPLILARDMLTSGSEGAILVRHQGCDASVRHGRQRYPYSLREIGGAIGRTRRLIDEGASPEFVKRQRSVDTARVVEVAID